MGQSNSTANDRGSNGVEGHGDVTLYYFEGRGLADQIRWLLAATDVSFVQVSVNTKEKFLKLKQKQLLFGQLPLLQIDGLELVQSQSIIRYLARRAQIAGETPGDETCCDMIAECIRGPLVPFEAIFFISYLFIFLFFLFPYL